ncbi:MAG TPA: hypothetical protein VFK51_02680 [Burkholderiales bacterium]|jgi:hypothetical protein|nr:hypothetical protein [Burkholderiales bacterium]
MFRSAAILILTASLGLPLAASAAASQADYQTAYQQALAVHKKAGTLDNQWTTTGKVLKAAQAAAKQGDYDKAATLAGKAKTLAQLAVDQAQTQKQTWKKAVVR